MNNNETEWSFSDNIFCKILTFFKDLDIDLFASRLNFKIKKFISWKADPLAWAIDAFTLCFKFYAFSPFSIIDFVCQKIIGDHAEGILVVPFWNTQIWFTLLLKICVVPPYIVNPSKYNLILPNKPESIHPLTKMKLLICKVSSKIFKETIYPTEQFQFL